MYEMKDEFKTGIEIIDNEHKMLFEIADKIYNLSKNEFIIDKYDRIVNLIEELKGYAALHFRDEEAYMESINYKKMFTQKVDHDNFIKKLNQIDLNDLDANQEDYILELLDFINDWLVSHILEKDKLIAQG
ncbi:hemerythrin family protein [Clostridium sp. UBA1056]|jgi:hemerythrin|uniref:bacteriohemerythrin n=1 Tax=unclassified Clostridium TaxID=2614128 RepID=UPI00321760ED